MAELPPPHFSFEDCWHTIIFICGVWIVGKGFSHFGLPSLVGEILVGTMSGPTGLDLVPNPEALMLFGEIGLILLVLEAGLDVEVKTLRVVGLRGLGVALVGSFVPLSIGFGLAYGVLGLGWQSALTAGCTLAPTSMGIALKVLKAGQVLETPTGQLIICAAVLDDVIALILLSQLQALAAGRVDALTVLKPVAVSVGLVLGVGLAGLVAVPRLTAWLVPRLPARYRDKAPVLLLGCLMLTALGLIALCDALGSSHLLGAFLAGLCFCSDASVRQIFEVQVKRMLQWLIKLFFAATIAFEIPVRTFGDGAVVSRALLFFGATVGKLATALWAKPLRLSEALMVGFAMAAWGEFAFIIATVGRAEGLIDSTTFSALILAVVLSIVVMPICLRLSIGCYSRREAWRAAQHAVVSAVPGDSAAVTAVPPAAAAVSTTAQLVRPSRASQHRRHTHDGATELSNGGGGGGDVELGSTGTGEWPGGDVSAPKPSARPPSAAYAAWLQAATGSDPRLRTRVERARAANEERARAAIERARAAPNRAEASVDEQAEAAAPPPKPAAAEGSERRWMLAGHLRDADAEAETGVQGAGGSQANSPRSAESLTPTRTAVELAS